MLVMVIYSNFIVLNNNEARINSIDPEAVVVITSRMCLLCLSSLASSSPPVIIERQIEPKDATQTNQSGYYYFYICACIEYVRYETHRLAFDSAVQTLRYDRNDIYAN